MVCICLLQFNGTAQDSVTIGKYKKINSSSLGGEVTYIERLPDGYEKSNKTYPVLYLLNAQSAGNFANAFATLDNLMSERIPDMILIGISNEGVAGNYWGCPDDSGHTTAANNFYSFLEKELIPEISKNYRTNNYKILYGQSNVGLYALNNLLFHPGLFDAWIIASPMLGWCPEFFQNETKKFLQNNRQLNKKLYISYGGLDYVEVTGYMSDFEQILKGNSPSGLNWQIEFMKNEGHVPFPTLNNALLFFFSECTMTPERKKYTVPEIKSHFEKVSKEFGFNIQPKGNVLFDMAMDLKNQKKFDEAIALCTYLISLYPGSSFYYYGLGLTFYQKGDMKSAKECFLKALEVDPEDAGSRDMIKKIDSKK